MRRSATCAGAVERVFVQSGRCGLEQDRQPIAICTLLLVIAGLLVRTLHGLYLANTGFDRDHVVTFTVDPGIAGWTREETKSRIRTLLERVQQLPTVAGAGLSYRAVMRAYGIGMTVAPAGERIESTDFLNTSVNTVSPGYFNAMGMRVLEGRDFSAEDPGQEKPIKVVVNEAFAQTLSKTAESFTWTLLACTSFGAYDSPTQSQYGNHLKSSPISCQGIGELYQTLDIVREWHSTGRDPNHLEK